jgi:hypothetical protein
MWMVLQEEKLLTANLILNFMFKWDLFPRNDKFITQKWQIYYPEMTNLLPRNDKFVPRNDKFVKQKLQICSQKWQICYPEMTNLYPGKTNFYPEMTNLYRKMTNLYPEMTNLLNRNDNFVTFHNKCPKIPLSTSMHFATRVRRPRVVRQSWSSRFFMQEAASKMRANNLSRVSTRHL